MNVVSLIGRMSRDPEVQYSKDGMAIARFGVAVNRRTKDAQGEQEVDFFDVTVFAKSAEFVGNYLDKGALVDIEGRLQQDRWHDRETGAKRSKVSIIASSVQALETKAEAEKRRAAREEAEPDDAVDEASRGYESRGGRRDPFLDDEADPFADD